MKVFASTVALLAVLALAGTAAAAQSRQDSIHSSASVQGAAGTPWRTEAWATAKLKTVKVWKGYRLDHWIDLVMGEGSFFHSRYNGNGEEIYQKFHVTTNTPVEATNQHHFNLTLYTTRTGHGFRLVPGWR